MSERNKAILQEANAAIDEGNTEGFLSYCTDDIEWRTVGDKTLRGKDAVRQWMATAYVEPPEYSVNNLIAEGDFVTALGNIAIKDEDGHATNHAYCDVWRFRGNKMAELNAFVIQTETKESSALPQGRGAEMTMRDPVEPLTAAALGRAIGNLTEETVLARERAGQFFSILRPARSRGREYPAFQTWPGISGEPLARVLEILRGHGGTAAYGFFTSPSRDLECLTPIEMLIGRMTNARKLELDVTVVLAAPYKIRLETVLEAAQDYAADLAA